MKNQLITVEQLIKFNKESLPYRKVIIKPRAVLKRLIYAQYGLAFISCLFFVLALIRKDWVCLIVSIVFLIILILCFKEYLKKISSVYDEYGPEVKKSKNMVYSR